MPARHSEITKATYFRLREKLPQKTVCQQLGIAIQTGRAWERNLRNNDGASYREARKQATLGAPKRFDELDKRAKKAWNDFGYFRRVYFGRLSTPWQDEFGAKLVELWESPKKEYVVINCPPGSGKSVLLKDFAAYMTVRNRAIRVLLGSSTQKKADSFARALKRELERTIPLRGEPAEVSAGRAFDAEATLSEDFGRFQPAEGDVWRANEFVVAQLSDIAISEKESTFQAFGLDGDYLGNRVDFSVWDDVDTEKTLRTIERIEATRRKWDKEVENRLEPGGLLVLVMQRKGPEDITKHCLSKLAGDDPDANGVTFIDEEGSSIVRKYHHFQFRAHDDEKCQELHSAQEPVYWTPDNKPGCLLDPVRLPWTDLQGYQRTDAEDYLITYQQQETDPASVLVNRLWITGGTDPKTGEQYYGCYDKNRALMQLPPLDGDIYSTMAVDPSGVNYWGLTMELLSAIVRTALLDECRQSQDEQFRLPRLGLQRKGLDWRLRRMVAGLSSHWSPDSQPHFRAQCRPEILRAIQHLQSLVPATWGQLLPTRHS